MILCVYVRAAKQGPPHAPAPPRLCVGRRANVEALKGKVGALQRAREGSQAAAADGHGAAGAAAGLRCDAAIGRSSLGAWAPPSFSKKNPLYSG
eukprot:COSAG01_NODE_19844_length_986_cov_0.925592_1_plen_93_part_10